jgi:hypothetical protein
MSWDRDMINMFRKDRRRVLWNELWDYRTSVLCKAVYCACPKLLKPVCCDVFFFGEFGVHFLHKSNFVHISSAFCFSDTVKSVTSKVTPSKWVRPIVRPIPTHDISMNLSEIRARGMKVCSLRTTALFLIPYWFEFLTKIKCFLPCFLFPKYQRRIQNSSLYSLMSINHIIIIIIIISSTYHYKV